MTSERHIYVTLIRPPQPLHAHVRMPTHRGVLPEGTAAGSYQLSFVTRCHASKFELFLPVVGSTGRRSSRMRTSPALEPELKPKGDSLLLFFYDVLLSARRLPNIGGKRSF